MPTESKPALVVSLRNMSIPIFERTDKKNGAVYRGYVFSYTEGGQRKQKRCRTLDSAKAEAQKFIRDRTEHQPHQREISLTEFADWSAAMRMLRGREQTTLVEVVAEWARAQDALGGRGTLADATAAFARTVRETKLPAITVPSLVAKFAAAKKAEGLSALYVDDIEKKLTRFSNTFRGHIGSIKAEEISQWIFARAKGRHANNLRAAIATLFSFARAEGYLSRDKKHAAELVRRVKERPPPIGIYRPGELLAVLAKAQGRTRTAMAIAAFGGLRITEVFRLEWSDVNLERGHIVVQAGKAKTASRRIVPILPALNAWLKLVPADERRGFVTPQYANLENISRVFSGAFDGTGVEFKQNGFRHSFASYRLATVKSADQVALEMGNSPRKLFTNYRELVTEEDAAKWFAVLPPRSTRAPARKKRTGRNK